MFKHRGTVFKSYHEVIDEGLRLKGKEQEEFVEAFAKAGPYALQNIGYISGYYDTEKADRIMEVFKTAHPIFGRRHPGPEEAFNLGRQMAEQSNIDRES